MTWQAAWSNYSEADLKVVTGGLLDLDGVAVVEAEYVPANTAQSTPMLSWEAGCIVSCIILGAALTGT